MKQRRIEREKEREQREKELVNKAVTIIYSVNKTTIV